VRNWYQKIQKLNYFSTGQRNHGAGATRNLGIEKASQNFIAFLDADDYYLPNRFDAEKELFKNSEIDGIFGAIGVEYLTEKERRVSG
jgi:glycosyltransferase involved in cell wall biosynthesis